MGAASSVAANPGQPLSALPAKKRSLSSGLVVNVQVPNTHMEEQYMLNMVMQASDEDIKRQLDLLRTMPK